MVANPITFMSSFVQKRIDASVNSGARSVTMDVVARWDMDSEEGLIIGSQTSVDASSCLVAVDTSTIPTT